MSDFSAIHTVPQTSSDVPDSHEVRLVVLSTEHPYSKDKSNKAVVAAGSYLQSRGNSPRLFQNALVFLAADEVRTPDLNDAACRYLAWKSICNEAKQLNLDPHQETQAQSQLKAADTAVSARLPETYQWLLIPQQAKPSDKLSWDAVRLTGQEPLAERAAKKLRSQDQLYIRLAGTMLRSELDKIPLWRGNHVEISQLVDDFAKYLYLPRLAYPDVLMNAVQDGLSLLLWQEESFAFADSYDETRKRYVGLRAGGRIDGFGQPHGLLVKPDIAAAQIAADKPIDAVPVGPDPSPDTTTPGPGKPVKPEPLAKPGVRRFYGTVTLDPSRVGRDAGRIADEVISHLSAMVGANVTVTLEINAHLQEDVPDNVVRTVLENARTLKFSNQGFEQD